MKSEQDSSSQIFSLQCESKYRQLKCSDGNDSIHLCMRQACQNTAFICILKNCKCKQPHKRCRLQSTINCIQAVLEDKIKPLKQTGQMIQNQIHTIIDQLSQFEDKIKLDLQKSMTYFGLTDAQNLLVKAFKNGQAKDVKGKHVYQIHQDFKKSTKSPHQISKQHIIESLSRFKRQKQLLQISIHENLFNQGKAASAVFEQSAIIKSIEQRYKMQKFFEKKIQKAQLLYRATRDTFKAAKFHQKCDQIPDTLTIVQTNKGKIFGGYTSCMWLAKAGGYYATDKQRQSFIFQFNNNDKFTLKAQKIKSAIKGLDTWGPIFGQGGHDIYIADDANIKNSYANIGNCYINDKYTYGNSQSREKFSGGHDYLVSQYEVWKIIFA